MTDVSFRKSALCGAAIMLLASLPSAGFAEPLACADVKARIEKQWAANGVAHPPLKIVPRGLVGSARVVGSCENGSQRIVVRPVAAASASASATRP